MNEALRKEITYLAIFSLLKRLYLNQQITKEVFDRLNRKNAQEQGCKPLLF